MKKSTNIIRKNIEKSLKDFKKEYKREPHVYQKDYFGQDRDIENIAWKLDQNDITVNFVVVDGESDSYTMATYHINTPKFNKTVILDWDVKHYFESKEDFVNTIEEYEKEGRAISKLLKATK